MKIILIAILFILSSGISYEVFAESEWYPGINLQNGDYFKYDFCHIDYFECHNIKVELLITNETDDYWNTQVIITDQDTKIEGIMKLSKNQTEFIGTTPTIQSFERIFNDSIVWLNNFSNKDDPKILKLDEYWGKIGYIGGPPLTVSNNELILIDLKIIDTTVVSWPVNYKLNKIWIVKDNPFPVKAETFAFIGNLPTWYKFELTDYKNNVEEIPHSILPPLKQMKQGVLLPNIECNKGLELVFKNKNNLPACVTIDSKEKLIKRGWALHNPI